MKKRVLTLVLSVLLIVPLFAGCHGSVERAEFALPDDFDTSKNYEITFGQKMTPICLR